MLVRELIEDLLNSDPELEVVTSGSDHSYSKAYPGGEVEAWKSEDEGHLSEHADGYTTEDYGYPGEIVRVYYLG